MKSFFTFISESQIPQVFPLTQSAMLGNELIRFNRAIETLQAAVDGSILLNASALKDLRSTISRAFEDTWQNHFSRPNFQRGGEFEKRTKEEVAVYYAPPMFHNIPGFLKKQGGNKSAVTQIGVSVAREYEALVGVFEDLKSGGKLKVGRITTAEPKPVNIDQKRGTCSWCARMIALNDRNHPAHHGYLRPMESVQTGSCRGIFYPCTEVSVKGIEARLKSYTEEVSRLEKLIKDLSNKFSEKASDPKWVASLNAKIHDSVSRITHYKTLIERAKSEIAAWKPGVVKTPNKKTK